MSEVARWTPTSDGQIALYGVHLLSVVRTQNGWRWMVAQPTTTPLGLAGWAPWAGGECGALSEAKAAAWEAAAGLPF